jgi:hypothetical protein
LTLIVLKYDICNAHLVRAVLHVYESTSIVNRGLSQVEVGDLDLEVLVDELINLDETSLVSECDVSDSYLVIEASMSKLSKLINWI